MTDLSRQFAALGDPTRFAIFERLLSGGDATAGQIGAAFPISAPAISRHLSVLHEAGLIRRRAEAQRRIYSVEPEAMQVIARWTLTHRDFWEPSLDRLEALINKGDDA